MKTEFGWHIHHETLIEPLVEPIGNRIKYIRKTKPEKEIPLRLKLLKKVKGKLPEKYVKAWEAYEVWEAYDKAMDAYDKAMDAFVKAREVRSKDKAWEACKSEIEELHRKECPNCPWDGETIFPEKMR